MICHSMPLGGDRKEEKAMTMRMIEVWSLRLIKWLVCIPLMILIGIIQATGTVLMAISEVVFKTISSLMVFVTLLLLFYGLFTWMQTGMVVLIAVSMFWLPEGIGLIVYGLCYVQAKLMDILNCA